MSKLFRLSAFNCQNLFSRARVLSLADQERAAALLEQVEQLAALLSAPSCSRAERRRIALLTRALARYVEITPSGLRLRRSGLDDAQRALKAKVICAVGADVQCLAEVEDRPALSAFNRSALGGAFAHDMLIGSLDPRAIDVGVMSRLPIRSARSHRLVGDPAGAGAFWRDELEVELALADGRPLHLLIGHFRSRGHGDPLASDAQRRRQADAVARTLATRFDLAQDLVAVLGDFGDSPQRAPQCLAPLLQLGGLHDALALHLPIPDDRWTVHQRRNEQVDYILVSDALKARLRGAGIERRGMPALEQHSIAQERPFAEISAGAAAASSHAAVWADFAL
jgi:endonuclease/exonuclease/phosphatase family metal-dependent hydrolase